MFYGYFYSCVNIITYLKQCLEFFSNQNQVSTSLSLAIVCLQWQRLQLQWCLLHTFIPIGMLTKITSAQFAVINTNKTLVIPTMKETCIGWVFKYFPKVDVIYYLCDVFCASDRRHVDWVTSYLSVWTEMQAFIKEHHTTGLVWSKTVSTMSFLPED